MPANDDDSNENDGPDPVPGEAAQGGTANGPTAKGNSASDGQDAQPARVTQSQAVRAALDSGHEMPAEALPWIRENFGLDVERSAFSAIKSKHRERQDRESGRAARAGSTSANRPGRRPGPPVTPLAMPVSPAPSDGAKLVRPVSPAPPGSPAAGSGRGVPHARSPLVVPPPPGLRSTVVPPSPTSEIAMGGPGADTSQQPSSRENKPAATPAIPAIPPTPPTVMSPDKRPSYADLLRDLHEIRRLKAIYGEELARMVEEV